MKILKYALPLLLLAATFSRAEAQPFKRLKKKAQDKLEQKAERKVDHKMEKKADKMVDTSWNAVFDSVAAGGKNGEMPFSMGSNAVTEDVYRFGTIATMKITTKEAAGTASTPIYMDMHFNEDARYTGTTTRGAEMENAAQEVFIIYDFKNAAMVMLLRDGDEKYSFAYDWNKAL